jgi:hypothetical protein
MQRLAEARNRGLKIKSIKKFANVLAGALALAATVTRTPETVRARAIPTSVNWESWRKARWRICCWSTAIRSLTLS